MNGIPGAYTRDEIGRNQKTTCLTSIDIPAQSPDCPFPFPSTLELRQCSGSVHGMCVWCPLKLHSIGWHGSSFHLPAFPELTRRDVLPYSRTHIAVPANQSIRSAQFIDPSHFQHHQSSMIAQSRYLTRRTSPTSITRSH